MSAERWRAIGVALALACAAPDARAATITIVNQDGPLEGFNDLTPAIPEGGNLGITRGQQRLNVFNAAAAQWAAHLESPIPIKVGAKFDSLPPCSEATGGRLGSAAATGALTFTAQPIPAGAKFNTWYAIALAEALKKAEINQPQEVEITATFNTDIDNGCLGAGTRFWYGIDNTPVPANRFALFPTVLHEIAHGLGFVTLVCKNFDQNGNPAACGPTPYGGLANGTPDIFTWFLADRVTLELWKDMTDAERAASITSDPNLVWTGANVTAAIPLFQPQGGGVNTGFMRMHAASDDTKSSNIAHFTMAAVNPNLLMEPFLQEGVFASVDFTMPLFRDIGWEANAALEIIFRNGFETP